MSDFSAYFQALAALDMAVLEPVEVGPHENCALDEVLARALGRGECGPHLRVWVQRAPQIVIGSGQSVANEVDEAACERRGITISRRSSGGGAMFMLPGDAITYSVVVPTRVLDGLSFQDSYELLDAFAVAALNRLGVPAFYVPINDIATSRAKIAGAAQKRFASGVTLHHTTASYQIDDAMMRECLRIGAPAVNERGHRSAAKDVDAIANYVSESREQVIAALVEEFSKRFDVRPAQVSEQHLAAARELTTSKYATPEWIYRIP